MEKLTTENISAAPKTRPATPSEKKDTRLEGNSGGGNRTPPDQVITASQGTSEKGSQ